MEAAVPAFIAALLIQAGDRSPWLVAILADRYGRPFIVACAALLAHAAGHAVAATGAVLIAPLLTPHAKQLLLALACLFAAAGLLWRLKPPDRLEGWRLGALLTPLLGVFILALGDTAQFFTLALGVRGASPWFAFGGACAGIFVVTLTAALMGEMAWRQLPTRAYRIALGLVALAGGSMLAAGALRLV